MGPIRCLIAGSGGRFRRPAFGPHGRKVIAGLCAWEIAALTPRSPVPTISSTVKRFPFFGWLLTGLLLHHWYLED